jgi:tetratricopeptide (TPR) repeat protein
MRSATEGFLRGGFTLIGFASSLVLAAVMTVPNAVHAQAPSEFTNLQYFPKTISRDELIGVMRGFSFSLGVRCQYCHDAKEGVAFKDTNFASDQKPTKKTARSMLRMVDTINREYIAKLESGTGNRVECVTCHHGLNKPTTMNAAMAEALETKGIDAAIALYRDLRKRDFGGGQYDFGETPLNVLTESLLKQKKTQAAAAIMELNVEVNSPPSLWAYNLLAMAHKANNEIDKAKADFRKILELNPDDPFAKKQLAELEGVKP